MKNVLKNNHSKFVLIGSIKGLAEESKRARSSLHKATSPEAVWDLASRKRAVGGSIRHLLLAYAFLRGKDYLAVEAKCADDNKPDAKSIFKLVEANAPQWIPWNAKDHDGGYFFSTTLEEVKAWLAKEKA